MEATVENYREKVAVLFENGQYKEIIDLLTDDILQVFGDAELYVRRATTHFIVGDDTNVVMVYAQKAIDIDDKDFKGYLVRGVAWDSKGDIDKAIGDYNKVIELNPKHAEAYYNRGIAWDVKGDIDKAIDDYTKVIELDPKQIEAYYNRGVAWDDRGDIEKAIEDYSKAIELNPKDAKIYFNRGIVWEKKGEINNAILDFNKAIELNPEDAKAYNNRGIIWKNKNDIDKAISDYNKAIELNPKYAKAYYNRGIAWENKGEMAKAVLDFSKAIELNPQNADAYYNRGLTGNNSGENLGERINDFKKYLELTHGQEDVWTKRAREFIKEFEEKIKDSALKEIGEITTAIKKLLLIKEGCITHYTGLTISKKLIIEGQNKFRISEGSFLNDTSEGTELFKFLERQFSVRTDGMFAETFAPKPFIGSFVSEAKHDDLNLWRFYGKENGTEAKGCAITLKLKEFIDAINFSISNGAKKAAADNEDDINFYKVAYWNHEFAKLNFHIPNSSKKDEKKLSILMAQLKNKVSQYDQEDTSTLEKYLNNIAFLFKSEAYKNENELRLVVKGIEFEKKIDDQFNPPKVYIELVNIRNLIEQITIGPKVEKAEEWAAAFYYSYDGEPDENKPKKIKISRLPYK